MNNGQERSAFEAWYEKAHGYRPAYMPAVGRYAMNVHEHFRAYQAGRAVLQEQPNRPALNSIIEEIHRRADKEWACDGNDFTVTITAEDYRALCDEDEAIDHARRIEKE